MNSRAYLQKIIISTKYFILKVCINSNKSPISLPPDTKGANQIHTPTLAREAPSFSILYTELPHNCLFK